MATVVPMMLKQYILESGQTAAGFGRTIGASRSLVTRWLNETRAITPHWALIIERASGGQVTRHDLRPDIYPSPSTGTPAASNAAA